MQLAAQLALAVAVVAAFGAVAAQECEVCNGFLNKFVSETLEKSDTTPVKIEAKLREACKKSKNRENRFCYYIGGLEDSATGILPKVSQPLANHLPVNKVCEKLKKADAQICELRYEKQIDLNKVDLKKLKVRDLKKILSDWDEVCEDCLEKGDYIKHIEKLKPKYVKTEL